MKAVRGSLFPAARVLRSLALAMATLPVLVIAATAGPAIVQAAGPAENAEPAAMKTRNQWLQERLLGAVGQAAKAGENPVFSFVYGGQSSGELLAAWPRKSTSSQLSQGRTQHTLSWTDAKTGLEVRCVVVEYSDFPAVEWTVYFKNTGQGTTPMLGRLQAIDTRIERGPKGEFLLKYQRGDTFAPDLYQPLEKVLGPGAELRFAPHGGRATNYAFPYYNLTWGTFPNVPGAQGTLETCPTTEGTLETCPTGGMFMAVGWPGQWATTFARDAARGLRIVAGQELVHLVLRPGEEIRTPLVALLFWTGSDAERAQNLWRRWMFAHNLPRTGDGKLPAPLLLGNTSMEFGEMVNANEENQEYFIGRYVQEHVKINYWWMDAGWYPCNGWPQTGTWEPDLKRFPRGLRAISDFAHARGIKTLVWFEPERVAGGTWLAENHPEWLLGGTLLNLGNPDARKWLTDHVDRVLREQGIDLYRQDFNMDPLDYWRRNDAPDRQGMTENLHVQGYLAYWDALRRRNPKLRIDSCASGGRRNDLETMRRAVPLHPTDFDYGNLPVKQAFHRSLFQWIPYFGSNTVPVDTVNPYAIRSGHAMSVVLGYDFRRKDLDYPLLRKLTDEIRLVAPYYYGDYYPLTPYSIAEDVWMAWQFHRPERGDGLIEAFRRPRSQVDTICLKLRGLDPRAVYEMKNLDRKGATRFPGRELITGGLPLTLARRPAAAVILYKRVTGLAAVISPSRRKCEIHEPITYSGTASFSPKGEIADYRWDFGDGTKAGGPSAEHAYKTPGTYTVKLTVTDRQGAADSACATITATPVDATPPTIVAVASGEPDKVGVVFSEPVQQAGAESVSNYAVDRGVRVLSASLAPDLRTVTLRTLPLSTDTAYTLTVEHVKDRARAANPIAPHTRETFRYSGMYGWWKLDDGKGDVAVDSSGNGHHAVLLGGHGGPRWVKSTRGTALRFDGVDARVEADTFFPNLKMPFTIALWVNPAATQVEYADILGNHGEPFVGLDIQQDVSRTNWFGFGYGDGRKWQGAPPAPLAAGRWQHLAVVCDGRTSVLYVDGVEKTRGPGKGPLAPNPGQNFKLGQGYHGGRYFHGLLSDVRIYRHALSAAEVARLAKQGGASPR